MKDYYFEAVEVCPHCDAENIYPMFNTEVDGFVTTCKYCGKEIFLCDECQHTILEDGEVHNCDWCQTECGGKCHRGETINNTVFKYDVECFERELLVVYPNGFDGYRLDVFNLLNDAYDKWHSVEDIEDDDERQYVQYCCLEEFMVGELSKQFPEWIRWKSEYYGNDEEEKDDAKWIINGNK